MTILTIIYFILVLGITIFIHELGHFIFAKRAKIYCYEFSLGMGPVIWKFNRKNDETTYSLRLFPIGGFVQMAGEAVDLDEKIPEDKRLQSKTWLQRFLTVIAGVMFNFLLAIVIFFTIGLIVGTDDQKPYVATMDPNFKISESNLKVDDQVLKVNGVDSWSSNKALLLLTVNSGKDITLQVKHSDGTKEDVVIKPTLVKEVLDEKGNLTGYEVTDNTEEGIYKYGLNLYSKETSVKVNGFLDVLKNIGSAFVYSIKSIASLIDQMFYILVYLFTGKLALNNLSGPIGIYEVVGQSARLGFINVVYLIGYICVNVGFINLLPLPAFDGGRVLFMIIEKIKGKPVSPKVENTIHAIGLILLMILMVVITYNDIIKFFIKA